ncbi:MAG: LysR family transcriptional regulator [Pseudomonadota bacterium]
MDVELLEGFLAVVEHGSILSAAEASGVSQPTLSRKIRELEDSLGVLLFNRTTRGVSLTVYGETFQAHAEGLLRDHRRVLQQLSALKNGTHGHARIGLAPALSAYLPTAISRLLKVTPEVTFEVLDGTYDALVHRILKGEIDGALTMLPPGESVESLAVRRISSEPVVILAGKGHRHSERAGIGIEALKDDAWILINRPRSIIDYFYQFVGARGLAAPKVAIETSSLEFLKSMVERERLLTVLPRGAVLAELRAGTFTVLDVGEAPAVETAFVSRHGVLPPLVTQLVQEVEAAVRADQAAPGGYPLNE